MHQLVCYINCRSNHQRQLTRHPEPPSVELTFVVYDGFQRYRAPICFVANSIKKSIWISGSLPRRHRHHPNLSTRTARTSIRDSSEPRLEQPELASDHLPNLSTSHSRTSIRRFPNLNTKKHPLSPFVSCVCKIPMCFYLFCTCIMLLQTTSSLQDRTHATW